MAHSDTAPRAAPLYATLADSLQTLIDQGTLKPGHRIPSVRRMAMQRDVSIATVLQAYSVLENRGLLEARPQSGYYVRPKLLAQLPEPRMARPMAKPAYVGDNDLAPSIVAQSEEPEFLPLGAACPDPALFPNRKLARILGAVVRDDPALLGRYAMNSAHEPLAREIARRYLQAGAPLNHDELVITSDVPRRSTFRCAPSPSQATPSRSRPQPILVSWKHSKASASASSKSRAIRAPA